jgi:hypothetical protein
MISNGMSMGPMSSRFKSDSEIQEFEAKNNA